jgi:hypothetical protein
MDKRWKNLFIILIFTIAAISLIVRFMYPSDETTFNDGLQEINSFWSNESINPAGLSVDEMRSLDEKSISNIEQGLNSLKQDVLKTEQGSALSKLADIHLAVVDIIRTNKVISGKILESESLDESMICGNSALFVEINSLTKELAAKTKEKNNKIADFSLQFPAYSQTSGVEKFISDETAIDSAVTQSGQSLQDLQSGCGGLQ